MTTPNPMPAKAASQAPQYTSSVKHPVNGHIHIYRFAVKADKGADPLKGPPFPFGLLSTEAAWPVTAADAEGMIKNGHGTILRFMTTKSAEGWTPMLEAWAKAGWPVQRIPTAEEMLPDYLASEGNIRVGGAAVIMRPVTSSNVHSIGYEPKTSALFVRFLGAHKSAGGADHRHIYRYTPVPVGTWEGLCKAESVGAYLTSSVKRNPSVKTEKLY